MMNIRGRIELLAPVGKWDTLEAVISAGADAVYLGGKSFNMRMWRSEFNFSDAELQQAVNYAHNRGVKVYVTVNNLYYDRELPSLEEHLLFLEQSQADAIIVQDLAIAGFHQRAGLRIPLHASVQMGIHNAGSVTALRELGFSRVVMSKNLTLSELDIIGRQTGMELEYFLHGDMCFSQTGQCYTSGLLFGESSNRGRCLKPCRWPYDLVRLDKPDVNIPTGGKYLLSHKDLCLLPFIPDLIQAGIVSLKIEGRMREASYLKTIVSAYRRAIDAYYEDPIGYKHSQAEWAKLSEEKQRNWTSGHIWGNPGACGLDPGGREPRPLSVPPVIKVLDRQSLPHSPFPEPKTPRCPTAGLLGVRAGSPESVTAAAKNGADLVYIGGESFVNGPEWDTASLKRGIQTGREHGSRVVLAFPGITSRRDWPVAEHLLELASEMEVDGVLAGNLGILLEARNRGLSVFADYSLNISNAAAAEVMQDLGAVQATANIEMPFSDLLEFHRLATVPVEAIVHGALTGMISDYCLPGIWMSGANGDDVCRMPCRNDFGLRDDHGQVYPVLVDRSCRNHIFLPYDLGLFPFIPLFLRYGLDRFRIEGQFYTPAAVGRITGLYRKIIDETLAAVGSYSVSQPDWLELNQLHGQPLGLGAYGYHPEIDL